MELSGVEAVSSLALFFENKNLLHNRHLLIACEKDLKKLKSFLFLRKSSFSWYELPAFPRPKSLYSETAFLERRRWQAYALNSENLNSLFLASPQALLKKTNVSLNIPIIYKGNKWDSTILKTYMEKAFVEKGGDFSLRGFVMDVFSPVYKHPLRIQLSGSEIQSIHILDESFKKRKQEISQAFIPSLYEWAWTGEDRKNLCDYLRRQEKQLKHRLPVDLFKSFSKGDFYFGFEHFHNCLDSTCSLDYFSTPPVVWIFEPEKVKSEFLDNQYQLEKEHPFFYSKNIFLDWEKIENLNWQQQKPQLYQEKNKIPLAPLIKIRSFLPRSLSMKNSNLPQGLKSFSSVLLKNTKKNLKETLEQLPVQNVVFTGSSIEKLKLKLVEDKILNSLEDDSFNKKSLFFLSSPIKESFFCPEDTAYLRVEDFIFQKKQNLSHFDFFRQRARALEFSELELGDLLVHRQHGVGEFAGLKSVKMYGKKEDFIVLKYKGKDRLFVPAYKTNEIKKYSRKR